jgi:DNA-binding NarL/FixJ family response regulator
MKSWEAVVRERVGDGSVPLEDMWHRRGEAGRSRVGLPWSNGAPRAQSGRASSPMALVPWNTQTRRSHGGRLGETRGDASVADRPVRLPGDRQEDITVVVCDHLPMLARGLAKLLEEEATNLRVTGVVTSPADAMRSIAEVHPVVAVIGLSCERVQEFDTVREICSMFPDTRIVVLVFEDEVTVASSALAGSAVAGYALKERDAAEIADVVSLVARGHVVAPAALAFPPEGRMDLKSLDDMEWEILKGVAQSKTNRELAACLHLSERTICRRLEGIYAKLDLADRLQAAVFAATHGLVKRTTWRASDLEA